MRRLSISDPQVEAAILARDIVARNGEILARAGRGISARAARALAERGVALCFVEDAASEGLDLRPIVDGPDGEAMRRLLAEVYRLLGAVVAPFATFPTPRALESVRTSTPAAPLRSSDALEALRATLLDFVRETADLDGSAGYLTDRQADDDVVGHSLHVAALATRIGSLVGLSEPDLAATAYAALLHDAGLLFVPGEIRALPASRWSAAQRQRFQDHTVLGEALLAPLAGPSLVASVVAAEHHEAQAGQGFPAGLRGGNRILRTAEDKRSRAQITLVSEVVAVADRWERLVSPGAGHGGMTPAAARLTLMREAGSIWNAEVVARFLAAFPVLPLGTPVRVVGGPLDGHEGIVSGLNEDGHRPRVRVYRSPALTLVTPVEVDLSVETGATVVIVDPALAA